MKKLFATIVMIIISSTVILMAQQSKPTTFSKSQKKMLVTYFSFPERDGVDASTGASRIVKNDKMYGSTEYVARTIADVTGADLFQIKTVHTYPNATHKELIDYAKKEADSKIYPQIASKIKKLCRL